ncbi:hypothetical protein PIROE2DRAFT_19080, partial [Piromyces sp. E2]
MIGMFVSTQPILLKYNDSEKSFLNIMKQNMNILMNIYENQDISFSELSSSLKLPNVNNAFIYQPKSIVNISSGNEYSIFANEKSENEVFELLNNNESQIDIKSKFDITFNIIEKENEYDISVDFNNNIYDYKIIDDIVNSFIEVIRNIENYNNKINEIEYIPKNEKERIIKEFNNNKFEYEFNKVYHEEFRRVAKQYPNKCAIVCGGVEITYKKLDEMTNSLAHYLRSRGIGKGDIVPIISERSQYYIIGLLATMKSGAAYLPIDPEFPKDRIEYMIEETNAKFILKYINHEENNKKLDIENLIEYSMQNHDYDQNIHSIENVNNSEDLCYVMFTSGTTGKPKGTLICHNNLINYSLYSQKINGMKDIYDADIDCCLAFSKFTFDMSVGEIHYPLLRGSKIVLCNDEEFNNPESISTLIDQHQIKYMFTVPSRLDNYLENEKFVNSIKHFKVILIGGEKLNFKTLQFLRKETNAEIFDVYGPTETTVICLYNNITEKIDKEGKKVTITIGKPLCNCNVYILDQNMKPVPVGVEGEIYIGGCSVGKGYLNRPELTNEKFVECPFANGQRENKMYRTGDLGKWNEEGEIIYLGRIDFQVKIRGQRIELSEIDNTVKEMNGIEYAVVIDKQNEEGNKYLVCYYMSNENINGKEIRNYLKNKLPLYMIPNYFISIENIPVTANGKLDRRALPEPKITDLITEQYVVPETEIEKLICRIYSSVFNINENEIGKINDFYELGGDSLNAIRVSSKIEKELNIKINIKDILSNSVVCDLSKFIENILNNDKENYETEIIKRYNSKEFPITSQQLGVYIDSIKNSNSIIYNVPYLYKFKRNIDINKIKAALIEMFNEQEILR